MFFAAPQIIRDPTTGLPFPGNVIPANRLSSNGLALLRAFPAPTPGFRSGVQNAIINSENPQDQRKDNLRFDYRLNAKNSFVYRYGKYNWVAIDAFRGDVPYARTDWDRPNTNQTLSWTSTLSNTLVNEASYTYGLDEVFINVLESDAYKRTTYGVTYPYLFPQNKEIADKLPTISIANLGLDRRRPVSGVLARSDPHVLEHDDVGEEPAYDQGRHGRRVFGRGRLRPDQRAADPRQHQQPERAVRVPQQRRRRARARAYRTRRSACSPTTPRSASAR